MFNGERDTRSASYSFLDGYCRTVLGLLDWFEVDLGFTELLFIQIDLCVIFLFSTPQSHSPLVLSSPLVLVVVQTILCIYLLCLGAQF